MISSSYVYKYMCVCVCDCNYKHLVQHIFYYHSIINIIIIIIFYHDHFGYGNDDNIYTTLIPYDVKENILT